MWSTNLAPLEAACKEQTGPQHKTPRLFVCCGLKFMSFCVQFSICVPFQMSFDFANVFSFKAVPLEAMHATYEQRCKNFKHANAPSTESLDYLLFSWVVGFVGGEGIRSAPSHPLQTGRQCGSTLPFMYICCIIMKTRIFITFLEH